MAALPIALILSGGYFLILLRGFFLCHPRRTLRFLRAELRARGEQPAATLTLALAGTLGVGNIVGVSFALLRGGAGSVFWMLVSALFASALKYAESVAALTAGHAGAPYYGMAGVLRTHRFTRPLAPLYAFLAFLVALFMGAVLQSGAVADAAYAGYGLPRAVTAALVTLLVLWAALGGVGRIQAAVSRLIPWGSLIYAGMCLAVILAHTPALPAVFRRILTEAFTPTAAFGGIGGYLFSHAVREGFLVGLLSNEAGAGTSALAHIRARHATPAGEGLLGVAEVFFDTVALCLLTALAVLTSGVPLRADDGMSLVLSSFATVFGGTARLPLTLCVTVFAYATAVCWYYYAQASLAMLTSRRCRAFLPAVYGVFLLTGAVLPAASVTKLTDALLAALTALTLPALFLYRRRIKEQTVRAGLMGMRSAGAPPPS